MPRQELRRSPRVEMRLPFSYYPVDDEIVMSEQRQVVTVDVGYYGLLVESAHDFVPHSEVKLSLIRPAIAHTTADIYAKVVKALQRDRRKHGALEITSLSDADPGAIRRFLQLQLQGARFLGPPMGEQHSDPKEHQQQIQRLENVSRQMTRP